VIIERLRSRKLKLSATMFNEDKGGDKMDSSRVTIYFDELKKRNLVGLGTQ